MVDESKGAVTLHATTVALNGNAALIRGKSGSGKSGLALNLMAFGAELVADDRTKLWVEGDLLLADTPDAIRGQIEARGIGILNAPYAGATAVALIVDLDRDVTDRLPMLVKEKILGMSVPVIGKVSAPHFNSAILTYLKYGRIA